MSETIREMIPEADLAARIAELGAQISKDYEGESVYVICILRGEFFLCLRTGKKDHRSGNDRFYDNFQLWFRYRIYR